MWHYNPMVKCDGPQHSSQKGSKGIETESKRTHTRKQGAGRHQGAAQLAGEREAEAARLRERARELQRKARLEDIQVWTDCIVKQTKTGEKKYGRWLAGWREGDKIRKVYLGSCKKMSREEALQKARKMKAAATRMAALCKTFGEHSTVGILKVH